MEPVTEKIERYQYLETLLASREWEQLMIPHLKAFKESDMIRLSTPRREDSLSDDFLRGRIDVFNFMLNGLPNQLEEWRKELFPDATEATDDSGQPETVGSPYMAGSTPDITER